MKKKKQVLGWALYDWANSAFATTVMAGFFPVFFKQYWSTGVDINLSTLMLGLANSVSGIIVALSAPVLGAIGDRNSWKKKFLLSFAFSGALMTSLLFLPGKGQWEFAAIIYVCGAILFSWSNIFYDSLLPLVAEEGEIDYVSSLGYALGYLGGGILFTINVLMTQKPEWFGLNDSAEAVRFSFLTVGLWWGVFTIPLAVWTVVEKKGAPHSGNSLFTGFRQVISTFRKIRQLPEALLFIIAYWFYIDGVDTIVRMAVDFGLSIGLESSDLILALLITQFTGFPSAVLFGIAGEKWDVKKALYIGIAVYIIVTIHGMSMTHRYEFYILAATVGLVQGGVQALSRSLYSRLIPQNREAEFFGFYNMLGKFAVIVGPVLMGCIGVIVRSMGFSQNIASRSGIASLAILFIIGWALLYRVDVDKGIKEAREFV